MSATDKRDSKRKKIDKPLAERKRRARINDALLQLKNMVLQSVDKQGTFMSKLEKADILEMTIEYINQIKQCNKNGNTAVTDPTYKVGFNECNAYVIDYLNNDVTSETADSGIRARLVKHLTSVSNAEDNHGGVGLQVVGILAPKTDNKSDSFSNDVCVFEQNDGVIVSNTFDNEKCNDAAKQLEIDSALLSNTDANVCQTVSQSTSTTSNYVTNLSSPKKSPSPNSKKRRVLGDVTNRTVGKSIENGNNLNKRCDRKPIPKPLKKRITAEMLQSSVENNKPSSCDIDRTVDFMTQMTSMNKIHQSSENYPKVSTQRLSNLHHNAYENKTGASSCQSTSSGYEIQSDQMFVVNSSQNLGQENIPLITQGSISNQECAERTPFYSGHYGIYLQGPLEESHVWRPW